MSFALRRLVAHEHAAGLLHRCRERHHRGGCRNGLTTRLVDGERLLDRRHAGAHVGRQDPIQLGQRSLDGRRIRHQTQPAGGEQAEGQGQGFVVGEDERREAEPRPQPVPAVTAALGFDRDTEILQHRDVAADRAEVDLQSLGQLRTGELATRLKQLQDRENACRRVVHVSASPGSARPHGIEFQSGGESGPSLSAFDGTMVAEKEHDVLSPPNRKCATRAVTPTAGADDAERLGHAAQYLGSGSPRARDAAAKATRGRPGPADRDGATAWRSDCAFRPARFSISRLMAAFRNCLSPRRRSIDGAAVPSLVECRVATSSPRGPAAEPRRAVGRAITAVRRHGGPGAGNERRRARRNPAPPATAERDTGRID